MNRAIMKRQLLTCEVVSWSNDSFTGRIDRFFGVVGRGWFAVYLLISLILLKRLTFKFQGLQQRLTGVEPARVIKEILA